jgi:hypothetical protein
MKKSEIEPEFWVRADKIIDVANEQVNGSTIGKVSASLQYGTARFCAYNVAVAAANADDMKRDRENAINYFTDQFKKMLTENIDDYIANYESFRPHE